MKIKVDSCISTHKEFYATIYPESEKEADDLQSLIILNESKEVHISEGEQT